MKNMKKLASVVLAMVMVLAMALPVSAEDSYTITIKNNAENHVYEAYQIFAGDISENGKTLSNVTWGTGVNNVALLTELKTIEKFATATSAADVAKALEGVGDDSDLAKTFAAVAGKYLTTDAKESTKSTETEGTYTINVDKPGYYLVKDKNTVSGYDSATRYILKVVGNVEVSPKGTVPSVDKLIVEGENKVETGTYNIGDDVTFQLKGTLPSNYADYTSYKYEFHDTLSNGLTYNAGSVKVTVGGTDITDEFTVNHNNGTLTITCNNLKTISDATIDEKSEIIVTYTAKLNVNAVIGGTGNPNTVKLTFSNDPNYQGTGSNPDEPTGTTPEDTVYVFTFELDVTKVDGKDNTKLSGAEFKLKNEAGKWVKVDENHKVTGWADNQTDGSVLTSGEDGLFKIIGLEDGTYYLKEIKAPDGYNNIENEIKIEITSSYDTTGVKTLQIKVDNGDAKAGIADTGVVSMDVENNKGATLPSTGGTGTTVLYLVGGALVLIAVVLMVTKKRMSAEK